MFKQLTIRNFQSHKESVFEFSPYVNVIQGLSTVGKTAVLRALRLLTDNRPSGARFFSDFAGEKGSSVISLELDNGKVEICKNIRINKDGKKELQSTHYHIEKDGQEFNFTGVGESIPDQVRELLNLSELNAQRQFDLPFLVSSSAGEIARTINRITNLEKVDEWVAALTSLINDANREIVSIEGDIKAGEIELEGYSNLDEVGQYIDLLQKVNAELNSLLIKHERLDASLILYESKVRDHEKLLGFAKAEKYIVRAEKIQNDLNAYEKLNNIVGQYDSISKRQDVLKKIYDEISDLLGKIKPVDTAPLKRLESLLNDYEIANESNISKGKILADLKQQYIEALKKAGKCPTCFSEMSEQQLKRLEKTL